MKDEASAEPAPLHKSRSAGRALSLLDTVVSDGPIGLTPLARAVDLPASTTLRHLGVLADAGYVRKSADGRYSAGPTFLRLALRSLQRGPMAELTEAAKPGLVDLVEQTEESAYLAVRDGSEVVYIATEEGTRAIRHVGWVGRSVPVEGTAVGEALLSAAPEPGHPITVFTNIGAVESDVGAVVAPIVGVDGVVGAYSVLGPADRLRGRQGEQVTTAVRAAATRTSALLGGIG